MLSSAFGLWGIRPQLNVYDFCQLLCVIQMLSSQLQLALPLAITICILYIFIGLGIHYYQALYGHHPYIHESSVGCLIGIIVGALVKYFTGTAIKFDNNIFFYLVLPPIIFSLGFSMKRKRFFQYIHQISFFGLIGTISTILLIAVGAASYKQITNDSKFEVMSWNEIFLFASVLAASDEVSAMSLIKIKDFPRLGALVLGEGVINDALSIVMVRTFLSQFNSEYDNGIKKPSAADVGASAGEILGTIVFQIVMATMIGIASGLLNALIMKRFTFAQKFPILQTALVLLFGYLAYAIAEACEISGILALFVAAIILAHYSWYSLSSSAQITTRLSFAAVSVVAEAFAFTYVGLSVWMFELNEINVPFAFYTLLVVLISRSLTVFGLFALFGCCSRTFVIPFNEQVGFMLGGFVRGSICWAQVLQIQNCPVLVFSGMIVVLSTTLSSGVVYPWIFSHILHKELKRRLALPTGGNLDITAMYSAEGGMSPETTISEMTSHLLSVNRSRGDQTGTGKRPLISPSQPASRVGFRLPHQIQSIQKQQRLQDQVTPPRYGSVDSHILVRTPLRNGEHSSPSVEGVSDEEESQPLTPVREPVVTPGPPRKAPDLASFLFIQWIRFDEMFMKPLFGGSKTDYQRQKLITESSNMKYSLLTPSRTRSHTGGSTSGDGHAGEAEEEYPPVGADYFSDRMMQQEDQGAADADGEYDLSSDGQFLQRYAQERLMGGGGRVEAEERKSSEQSIACDPYDEEGLFGLEMNRLASSLAANRNLGEDERGTDLNESLDISLGEVNLQDIYGLHSPQPNEPNSVFSSNDSLTLSPDKLEGMKSYQLDSRMRDDRS